MSTYGVSIGSIGQGLALAGVGIAVFITFRILNFPDLSVDASFPIGGAIAATMILNGVPDFTWEVQVFDITLVFGAAETTVLASFVGGALTGMVTGLIHVLFKIEGLLASIIVMTGAWTIILRIMGTSNIPLLTERTMLRPYVPDMREFLVSNYGEEMRRHASNAVEIIVFSIVVVLAMLVLNWFLNTEIGLALRASGKNSQMVRAVGVNDKIMVLAGLMISNGLSGMAGALTVQQLGFADVQMGIGMIVRGLAAVMIGEVLLRPKTIWQYIISSAVGMLVFEISKAWVFSALNLAATDVRFMSAAVVLVALAAPYVIGRLRDWERRRRMERKNA